jgi:hypothetical protein
MLSHILVLPALYIVFTEVDRLSVDAEPAVAVIALHEGGRKLVRLPELEFVLSVSTRCAANGRPESLSITIADTRESLRGEALQEATTVDVPVRVSANQLAPFALQEFCTDPAAEGDSITLSSALTAQASLRCARDEQQSIVFAAEPLDVLVYCIRSESAAEPVVD